MKLSIVTTMYHSAPHLEEFYNRARAEGLRIAEVVEFVMVNDGSPDNALDVALSIRGRDPGVTVVDLSRNFGHYKAMMTGLAHATGDLVFLIDCDLEEQPEWLSEFRERMLAEKADVAYGVQKKRKGGFVERVTGSMFYSLHNALSDVKVPPNQVTARLMTRRYVQSLIQYTEREVFIDGLWYDTGFRQVPVMVSKLSLSPSTYSLGRKLSILINSVTSFSDKPLVGIFYTGLAISMLSLLYSAITIARRVFLSIDVPGYTSIVVSIWLVGGLIILFIGVIGLYLSKVFMEAKRRPYVIIRQLYGRDDG